MGSAKSRFKVMTLTDAAAERVREIMANAETPLAGLRVEGVRIEDPACVGKTFPDYWERLSAVTAMAVGPAG